MDGFVEGVIAPRHSEGQTRGRQDIQDQSAMGSPDTHYQQRWTAEMELVWSTVQLGSIRPALRENRVSHCLGLCLHRRIPEGVREKNRLDRHHGSPDLCAWHCKGHKASFCS